MTGHLSDKNRTPVRPDNRTGQPPPYRGVRPVSVRCASVGCEVEITGVMLALNPPAGSGRVCVDCWLHGPPDLLGRV